MSADCCAVASNAKPLMAALKKPKELTTKQVRNGFVVNFWGNNGQEELIANTLLEALELIRKEME